MPRSEPLYITLTEAAQIAGVSQQYISQLVVAKKLPSVLIAGRKIVLRSDAYRLKAKRESRIMQMQNAS